MKMSRRQALALTGSIGAAALAAEGAGATAAATSPARDRAVPSGRADGVLTGGSRRIALSSGHEVWVKQIGHGAIPVLTLHGGPGATHFYLECFEDFLPRDKLRYWYYDQLGCGFSDRPNDTSLWTVERFRAEVEEVRAALGLERFVLYGHSWGGLLAIEYTLAYPQHVDRLVISSMTASYPSYARNAAKIRASLPAEVRAAMDRFEAKGATDSQEYEELLIANLYSKYVCRLDPWPEPVTRAFQNLSQVVYNTIQGPSEFTITGNAKDWDRFADLHKIAAPTLLIVGRYDEMPLADVQRMATLIPNSKLAICENGSHMCMYDDQQAYFDALVPFLLTGRETT